MYLPREVLKMSNLLLQILQCLPETSVHPCDVCFFLLSRERHMWGIPVYHSILLAGVPLLQCLESRIPAFPAYRIFSMALLTFDMQGTFVDGFEQSLGHLFLVLLIPCPSQTFLCISSLLSAFLYYTQSSMFGYLHKGIPRNWKLFRKNIRNLSRIVLNFSLSMRIHS